MTFKIKIERKGITTLDNELISTGSTLLDLTISGGVSKYGGLPGGSLVEIFGPSSLGKTALACEIVSALQRKGGKVVYEDSEGRLNTDYTKVYGIDLDTLDIQHHDTIEEVFNYARENLFEKDKDDSWKALIIDSTASLSTEKEMESEDKMGALRAKKFSEECRKTCRVISGKKDLIIGVNQIRQKLGVMFGKKTTTPGGEAIGFYANIRLEISKGEGLVNKKVEVLGTKEERTVGIRPQITVVKSSVDNPFRECIITVRFNYGIDDIYDCLQYLKDVNKTGVYMAGDVSLGRSIEGAIEKVEGDRELRKILKESTVLTWHTVDDAFKETRQPKERG